MRDSSKKSSKRYCVLGQGISYTLSPTIHNAVFAYLGESAVYTVEDVSPDNFEQTLARLLDTYEGFNVTKPYKEKVAALLHHDGPVNTVRRDEECTTTDPIGFYADYTDAFGQPCGKILLLGAGGAAKAVADALRNSNAQVYVYNRTYAKAQALQGGNVQAVKTAAGQYDAVINCTSLGLHGEQAAPTELTLDGVRYAYDLIYSPPETPFLASAKAAGAKVRNGLGMLIEQAVASQEFWRDCAFAPDVRKALYAAIQSALAQKM